MAKIVVTMPMEFSSDQKARLDKLGEVKYYDKMANSPDEWLKRVEGFEIICTGKLGFKENWDKLRNAYVSLPFVAISWMNTDVLKKNKVVVSNSPGCNRHAVSEWIIGMMILMARQLDKLIRIDNMPREMVRQPMTGLAYKNIAILGAGNIGKRVGEIARAMEMDVSYFRRGDDIKACVKNADVIVDVLGSNPSTDRILNKEFFDSVKDGALFLSVTGETIIDIDAMLAALDSGKLAYVAHDSGGIQNGDTKDPFYQRLLAHPKVYLTPHVAYNTDVERKISNDMMIDNVETWLKGKPINTIY